MTSQRRSLASLVLLAFVTTLVLIPSPPSLATQQCGTSNGVSLCLSAPDGALSGDVSVSVTTSGSLAGVSAVVFYWGPSPTTSLHLLQDFAAPYGFTWRTDLYPDASQFLVARVQKNASTLGNPVSLPVTIDNGNGPTVPPRGGDWASLFHPRAAVGDPVVAAVGDGGDGVTRSNDLAASIATSEASVLLYLGDIYEKGTPAEWDFNFGRAVWDQGGGQRWGALTPFTVPVVGNHEEQTIAAYNDYWHGRPPWDSFVYGGVRFLALNSECTAIGGCGPGSAQYAFVQSTLASNSYPCVVAMWHRPVLSAWEDRPTMEPIWALLANGGGDLVLNGHTHTMQRFRPMNATLQAGMPDSHMVEVISGAGGHNLISAVDTDARSEWQLNKVTASMYLTLEGGGEGGPASAISWQFRQANGSAVNGSSSSVSCGSGGPPADTTPPSAPGMPTGVSHSSSTIDLSFAASTDDLSGTLTYRVSRDGTQVGTVTSSSTTTIGFQDTGLAPASTHTYSVLAVDGANNVSDPSPTSDPVTTQDGPPPPAAVFADDFSAGFANWSGSTALTIDASRGGIAPPSARAQVANAPGWAYRTLPATLATACMSMSVNVASRGSSFVTLLRLRTAANGNIVRVFMNSAGVLWVKSDVSGAQRSSGTNVGTGWHQLELCGGMGTWSLYRDGIEIVTDWSADTGTSPVGRIEIGDTLARTFTANFDDVMVDTSP